MSMDSFSCLINALLGWHIQLRFFVTNNSLELWPVTLTLTWYGVVPMKSFQHEKYHTKFYNTKTLQNYGTCISTIPEGEGPWSGMWADPPQQETWGVAQHWQGPPAGSLVRYSSASHSCSHTQCRDRNTACGTWPRKSMCVCVWITENAWSCVCECEGKDEGKRDRGRKIEGGREGGRIPS